MHVGEAEVATGVPVGQAFVIDTQKMQDGGLEIMHSDNVLGDVVSQFITCTMNHAALDSRTGHPRTVNP